MKLTRTGRACTVIGSLALASQLVGCATNPKPIAIRQSAPPKSEFYLTITPRFILPGQPALLAAGHRGPLSAETYCPAWELTWPNGTKSTGQQDCPPYAEYVKAADYYEECMTRVVVCPPGFDCAYKCPVPFEPERRWTWTVSATTPGDHVMTMLFTVGGKRYLREVVITVPGTE